MVAIRADERWGNCLRVLYAAKRLGLDHNWVDVDILAGETRQPEFLVKNPARVEKGNQALDSRCGTGAGPAKNVSRG